MTTKKNIYKKEISQEQVNLVVTKYTPIYKMYKHVFIRL